MIDLFLLRHGNTFEPGETPRWVGAGQDLPLTVRGVEQAHAAAGYFMALREPPKIIFCGTLKRLVQTANIVSRTIGAPVEQDKRLNEVDFGAWGGLTDAEIEARGEGRLLDEWRDGGRWPTEIFPYSQETVKKEVRDFAVWLMLNKPAPGPYLVVSSNGKMRYFLSLIANAFEERLAGNSLKVGTGHISKLSLSHEGGEVGFWDLSPAALGLRQAQNGHHQA